MSEENLPKITDDYFLTLPEDNPLMKLDNKRRAFVMVYVHNGYKHREAAEEVGMDRYRGVFLLKEPLVQDAVLWFQSQEKTELQISKTEVVEKYKSLIDKAEEEGDLVALNRALEGVSKLMGYQAPVKTEQTITGKVEHVHRDDIHEQLEAKLQALRDNSLTVYPKPVEQLGEEST